MADEQEVLVIEASVVDVIELPGDIVELIEVTEPQLVVVDPPADIEVIEIAAEVIELIEVAEQGLPGPPGPPGGEPMPYAIRTDIVSDNLIYRAEALPGTNDADALWRIRRLDIGNDGDVVERWANGTADFAHAWSGRAGYSYI